MARVLPELRSDLSTQIQMSGQPVLGLPEEYVNPHSGNPVAMVTPPCVYRCVSDTGIGDPGMTRIKSFHEVKALAAALTGWIASTPSTTK